MTSMLSVPEHGIDAIKALHGRIFATLSPAEQEVLKFYRQQGRKFGVALAITHHVDSQELARATSAEQADELLRKSNATISVGVDGEPADPGYWQRAWWDRAVAS